MNAVALAAATILVFLIARGIYLFLYDLVDYDDRPVGWRCFTCGRVIEPDMDHATQHAIEYEHWQYVAVYPEDQ